MWRIRSRSGSPARLDFSRFRCSVHGPSNQGSTWNVQPHAVPPTSASAEGRGDASPGQLLHCRPARPTRVHPESSARSLRGRVEAGRVALYTWSCERSGIGAKPQVWGIDYINMARCSPGLSQLNSEENSPSRTTHGSCSRSSEATNCHSSVP